MLLPTAVIVLAGAGAISRRVRKSYLVWMILAILPGLVQNTWNGIPRFALIAFPQFIIFAALIEGKRGRAIAAVAICLPLMLLTATLFFGSFWVG